MLPYASIITPEIADAKAYPETKHYLNAMKMHYLVLLNANIKLISNNNPTFD
jgi:hypothetical protein